VLVRAAALVPFKCFTRAKGRLRTRYSDSQVEQLGRAMLADVLEALSGARKLERVTVLTDDTAVADVAREGRASVRLRQPDPGLNPVIEDADRELLELGFDASLVVLGDLPLLRARDIDEVVDAGGTHHVVIVPSSDGGTAILLRRPPGIIRARFGPQSARAHANEARARGQEPFCLTKLGDEVALDLDTPEDAQRLLECEHTSRTGELLRRFSACAEP
jgi:2-phospho-L-lactate guanylyltransferase